MKHYIHTGLASLLLVGGASLTGCDSFVEDIDGPVDRVVSDSLDVQGQVPFLITGVKEGFNDSYDQLATLSDLLADVGQFNQAVQNSTFPTFGEIDRGEIELDNNSNDNAYDAVNEYRFSADDLLRRANETIEFSDDEDGAEARRSALYAANFHGGVARYFLGTYYSVDGQNGAAPISEDPDNPAAPLPTAELYAQADAKLAEAAGLAATDYDRRVINTLRARIALFGGDRGAAAAFAQNGLQQTDDPYSGRYTALSTNNWWSQGGRGRTQISINDRFNEFDEADSRMLVETAPPQDANINPGPFYRQALYLMNSDPLPFLTWQENALILAEADVFDGGDDNDARSQINAVRASIGLADLEDGDAADQDLLIRMRDQALYTYGLRLVDQRRFDIFHLGADKQRFFPLPQTERNANPNI